ncbi:MAG: ABC transporter permease, partial [Bellilinea sp.]
MLRYILQRLILIPILLIIFSIMVFALVQAPPGDFLTSYIATLASTGSSLNQETIAMLEHQFGLDQPVHIQYLRWMQNLLRGDLGLSLEYQLPNAELINDRLGLTLILALFAFVFTWVMAIPIGIY